MKMHVDEDGVYWYKSPEDRYDWVSSGNNRTPEDYPYSHSEYYLWRDFENGDGTADGYYTDRMQSWDYDKYRAATKDRMTNWGSVPKSRSDAQKIVEAYFGVEFDCVGIAQSMNVSNGYPLGVFFIRKKVTE